MASTVEFHHRGLGVVIHPTAIIEDDVIIQHHVTIGINKNGRAPRIEKGAYIGAYAILLGDICVGKGAVIGAGTICMKSVEPGGIYTGTSSMIKRGQKEI